MRIDAYGAISQLYQSNSKTTLKKADVAQSYNDRIEFSQAAKSYQTAKSAVSNASDVRYDKVEQIKAKMAAGTYNISAEAVADKIISGLGAISF